MAEMISNEVGTSNEVVVESMMRKSIKLKTKEFMINERQPIIKKSEIIHGKNNMGIESIELCSIPEYLHCITLSFGSKTVFVWNRGDCTKYLNGNLLEKYQMKNLIPTFTHCYAQIKLNYIYDSEEVYKNCEMETQEIITKIAVEDTDKQVEYWDMDEQCACNAYGVKYDEVKSTKEVFTKSPTLQTPQLKIIFKVASYDRNETYKIPFYDQNIGLTNNLIVTNGNNYDVEF